MKVINETFDKILDCQSIFISAVYDDEDKNLIIGYNVKGSLTTGRTEVIAKFTNKDEAQQLIKHLTVDLDVCTRPNYFKERPQA
jgi:hypothetical protein